MRETISTTAVLTALAGKDCALCVLFTQAENAFIGSFLREMVLDGRCHERLAQAGLCPHHLHFIASIQDKLGVAITLRTLVNAAYQAEAANPAGRCFFCEHLEELTAQYAQIIVEAYRAGGEGMRPIESAQGFCLLHLELLSLTGARGSRRDGGALQDFCRRKQAEELRGLREELDWFIKKFDYRMAGESWRGTEDIVERTVDRLAGRPGVDKRKGSSGGGRKGKFRQAQS